jgi:hypothetical protein
VEDENRNIVLTNQLFCDMFGIPVHPDQLRGMDCSNSAEQSKSLFKDPDAFLNRINKVLADKNLITGDELELVSKIITNGFLIIPRKQLFLNRRRKRGRRSGALTEAHLKIW